jgi:IclR family transcriptional regulator, acetate operon repressor
VTVPRYPIASVDNALRILLHLRLQPDLRVADVARLLGVANSTAHRLLAALAHRGFVEQDATTRTYHPGAALLELGASARPAAALRAWLHPALVVASRTLGETVHLGVRRGRFVHYLDAVESERTVRVVARTGRALPAHCTSIGKVLLAYLADEELDVLYAGARLESETTRSITDLAALRADLETCRSRGYAVNEGESEDDVSSVAVAVHDSLGLSVAAIGCAAPSARLAPD